MHKMRQVFMDISAAVSPIKGVEGFSHAFKNIISPIHHILRTYHLLCVWLSHLLIYMLLATCSWTVNWNFSRKSNDKKKTLQVNFWLYCCNNNFTIDHEHYSHGSVNDLWRRCLCFSTYDRLTSPSICVIFFQGNRIKIWQEIPINKSQ